MSGHATDSRALPRLDSVSISVGFDERGAAASSNRQALASLFDENYTRVYRYCLARSGSSELADEISGEVFAEAARHFAKELPETISIGWLLTVARRRLIDEWRSDSRRRERLDRLARDLSISSQISEKDDGAVFEALRSLSVRQRAALTLRYLDDYSVSEVASALDCSYRAAESLIARARRSFAHAWEDEV